MSISDHILVLSTLNTREITASFCQHLFDNYEIEDAEVVVGQERVTVERQRMSIDTLRYYSPERLKQISRDILGFDPNIMIAIYYAKPLLDIEELRNQILRGVAELIKTLKCSLAVTCQDIYVLNYSADTLMLLEHSHLKYWTDARLRLFADIPYEFKVKRHRG